jgi:hypothetical protein
MTQRAYEPFIGVWELDPNTLDYQHGRPGRRATYTIEPTADDADGKSMHYTYGGKLNGEEIPIPNTSISLVLTMPDECTVESILTQADRVIDRWTRRVQRNGQTMVITQHGFGSNGEPFCNKGTYRRVR